MSLAPQLLGLDRAVLVFDHIALSHYVREVAGWVVKQIHSIELI